MKYVDCHIHVFPWSMLRPDALELYKANKKDIERIKSLPDDPANLIAFLDEANVEKAFLITNVANDTEGPPFEANHFVSRYCARYPDRLVPFGSVHPRQTEDPAKKVEYLVKELHVRGIKIHPCHQLVYPNEYRMGLKSLRDVYSKAQELNVPVMIHTGTSIFPRARIKFGDPMYVDDVAVDFPDLKIIIAHGGRPLWMETAFFLVRRHKNVYMDISGIPPKGLLSYFPRLEVIAGKTMFGSDWAGPMIPGIKENIEALLDLPLSEEVKRRILGDTALSLLAA